MIYLMLVHYAEQHMVKQNNAKQLIDALQTDLGLIDEGLAEMFMAELPNQIETAAVEPGTTFNGVGID